MNNDDIKGLLKLTHFACLQGREQDKVEEGEVGGRERRRSLGGKRGRGAWCLEGRKRESRGRIEVRLPALLRNGK